MGDDDGEDPAGCGDNRLQIGTARMELQQLGFLDREARDEPLTGDTSRVQYLIRVVVLEEAGYGGCLIRGQLLHADDICPRLPQDLDEPPRIG